MKLYSKKKEEKMANSYNSYFGCAVPFIVGCAIAFGILHKIPVTSPIDISPVERRGCCSRHNGVCGCADGRAKCCDGTTSPSCGCFSEKDINTQKTIVNIDSIDLNCNEKFIDNYY
jgi:hypothetical protein